MENSRRSSRRKVANRRTKGTQFQYDSGLLIKNILTSLESAWKKVSKPLPQPAEPRSAVTAIESKIHSTAPTWTMISPPTTRPIPTAPVPIIRITSTTAASATKATIISPATNPPTPPLPPLFPPSRTHLAPTASPLRPGTRPQSQRHHCIHLPLLFSSPPHCNSNIIYLRLFHNNSSNRRFRASVLHLASRAFPVS